MPACPAGDSLDDVAAFILASREALLAEVGLALNHLKR
jgi:hypothetical protein